MEDRTTPAAASVALPGPSGDRRAPATVAADGQRKSQNPKRSSDWRTLLANLGKVLGVREEPPAPVEERNVATASQLATARTAARSPQELSPAVESGGRSLDRSQEDIIQARRMVVDMVPSVAAQAQPDFARVLRLAASANHRSQQQAVVEAAQTRWAGETTWTRASYIEPLRARRLHDDARQAFASGRVSEAVDTELKAFGANPHDPDIASYLALLHIRMHPAQPETARQLALYAISVSGPQRSARFGDWDTLAVASALTGRDIEATRAFLVEVALTSNLDRTCQTALRAYANFGERLRRPVQAMLERIDSNGRVSPHCEWPVTLSSATR